MRPLISVVMPAFNAEKYIKESIESILRQTVSDFEFIIIDDGSTDNTVSIIRSYDDKRIRLISNVKNCGHIHSLNVALPQTKGHFVARMDADDISKPNRFAVQHDFLSSEKKVDLVGASIEVFGEDGTKSQTWTYPTSPGGVRARLLFNTSHAHPVVFFRRSLIERGHFQYDQSYFPAEDYRLWTMLQAVTSTSNVQEVLLRYRVTKTQTSSLLAELQSKYTMKLRAENYLRHLPNDVEVGTENILQFWSTGFRVPKEIAVNVLMGFELMYVRSGDQAFKLELGQSVRALVGSLYRVQPTLIDAYQRSKFFRDFPFTTLQQMKFKAYRWASL